MLGNNMLDCVVYFTVLSSEGSCILSIDVRSVDADSALRCREESCVTGSGLSTCTGID